MIKRFDNRIIFGVLMLLGGALLLLQTLGYLTDASDWFWGVIFVVAGAAFLTVLFSGQWWAVFPGMTLLALGVTALLPPSLEHYEGLTFLGGLGLAFWIVYFMNRSSWWALIPAGILTTLAVISVLPDRVIGLETGGLFFIGMAITFLLVALLAGHRWAYYPAAVLSVMGLLITASWMSFANYVWAAALIIAGGYLIFKYVTNRA
ncbi:MAG TPA: hypothetical protein VGJ22_11190 [Anaerolineales bacterium]|jgi:hypothetical protein